jgi:hypothetical protein
MPEFPGNFSVVERKSISVTGLELEIPHEKQGDLMCAGRGGIRLYLPPPHDTFLYD